MAWHRKSKTRVAAVVAAVTLGAAGGVAAQSMSTNSASFNAGYGRSSGQESRMVEYSTRDANGNRVVVDGVMLTGSDQSVFSSSRSSGSLDAYSGVGAVGGYAGSTAIGNNLTVITQGNNNTVIVNSNQVNTGNVTAGSNVAKGGAPK
ncbi:MULTISPECIES: holdfast anchoring protein HfaA [unclassified Caulobacter]|jgi:holdfast attachment protein HfaA|uniref:holdfast anchoring protein HfaA n=1 Tax=unclassified Caulobacter TaxID=2648921 RepID=UPI000786042F|nr:MULTISPECIES: holdfast anchoring protein HfaA [unclassified Caulobacter]AZS20520.1 endonuclease [Caulobacter sp. FWC26]